MENITNKSPDIIAQKIDKWLQNDQLYSALSVNYKWWVKYIKGIDRYPILSKEELDELFRLYYTTWDTEAHDKIILCNLRYLIYYCKCFLWGLKSTYNCDRLVLKDLIMSWYTWLVNAVESRKFVPGKWSFLSLAKYYIKWSLMYYLQRIEFFFWKEIEDRSRSEIAIQGSRIPKWKVKEVDKFIDQFYQINWRLPCDQEIIYFYSYELDFKIDAAKDSFKYYQLLKEWILSLDKIQDDLTMDECKNNLNMDMSEKVNTNNEIMTDKDSNADKKIEQESLRTDIFRALSTLTDREQKILKLFFWIGCPNLPLAAIWDIMWLNEERVRQIKEKAIRRLKSPSRGTILKKYL